MDTLEKIFLGNSLTAWGTAVLVFLLTNLGFMIFRRLTLRRISRAPEGTYRGLRQLLEDLLAGMHSFFIFALALYLGSLALTLPEIVTSALEKLVIVTLILQAALWSGHLVDYAIRRAVDAKPERAADTATTMNALSLVAKISVWLIAILLILENVTGIEVGTLLATLGIGGVAIALAVQGILGDLFASISISLDRPFAIGDTINIDDMTGSVEHIGLKSTRVRSVSGEQLVVSNSDLLSSRLRNYERMDRRRVLFTLGVTYQTPYSKLVQIPEILQTIITSHENTTFGHAYFQSYGSSALNFEVNYYLETPDFQEFVDTHQAINLEIFQRFENEGIEFAYPTQTVFLEQPASQSG